MVAISGGQRACLHLEFLQRIGKRRRQVEIVERVVVGRAVHDVGHAVGLPTRHRDGDRRIVLVGVEVRRRRAGRQTRQEDELGGLTPVQGHFNDALIVDDLAHAGRSGLDERRPRRYRHRLGQLPDVQLHIDRRIRLHLQDDAVLDIGGEPLEREAQCVGADRQVRQHVGTVLVGEHGAERAGRCLRRRDLDAWQDESRPVTHGA